MFLACLCLFTTSHAQTADTPLTQQVTLHVATAGTLSDMIAPNRRPYITNLKLTGRLNGTDIRLIREMAGSDVYGNPTQGSLEHLDLSEADIVSGGEAYYIDRDSLLLSTLGFVVVHSYFIDYRIQSELGEYHYGTVQFSNDSQNYLLTNCYKLKSVRLPRINNMGSVLYGCTNLTSVDIPEGVTELRYTFWDCTSLTAVIWDNNP